jgi:DNA topoisomerase-1
MTARANLTYVDDGTPGITRRRSGRYWQYFDPDGKRVTDREEIDRLNAIGLPPAYRDAWFSPKPNGHIQAIGYDDKGRKQYRYHPDFREKRETAKYDRCREFGKVLPKLRKRVEADLKKRKLGRDTVIAAVVRLLDSGRIRVGNEAYVQSNKSYGATTLRNRHARVLGRTVKMRFKAKSGVERELSITDATLSRIVKQCQDLPGQHLFQHLDEAGEAHPVTSTDVNDYIREATGSDFTAKHFRTWSASVIAFEQLCAAGEDGVGLKAMLAPVAEALGNTPAISRKSYVHPALIESVKNADRERLDLHCPRSTKYLSSAERGLIAFLGRKPTRKRKAARDL